MATNLYSSRTSNDAQIRRITEDISEIFIKDSKDLISLDFNNFIQKIEQISLKLEMVVKSYTPSSGKIESIKTSIAYANNTTKIEVLGVKMSIQGALNKIKVKRELAFELENLLQTVKVSKERKVDAAATSVYYKVTELNFDRKEMEQLVENLNEEVLELEIAINKANNETFIEI